MNYSVAKAETEAGIIFQLISQKFQMVCPFKTSTANMQPVTIKQLGKPNQNQMQFRGYLTQACDSTCPLFEYNEEQNKILTYCGNTVRHFKLEDPAPAGPRHPEEVTAPASQLRVEE